MPLALASTFALGLWILLWALGISGFDGLLLSGLVVLLVGGVRALGSYLPKNRRLARRGSAPQGGW
ncbi:hypothetical protein [Conexibacter sp. CPCC 206217]|uniref:hypothetical protein n=1 Tax=Conexibacter sp. CPCC 206217 TaxID=3064574 RepID=UPI00272141FC|nr:hypothetical protein [Conexibacter sp. CPCC 206217]MDO8210971.1 hypothetical protein [Conexibacter sp. CPCC 206217]